MSAQSKDFYTRLGVSKNASVDEIKRAYKKLVVKYHPDKYKDEKEKAEANAKFQEIQEAYDVLKDDKKRKQYDTLGHDAFKNGGAGGFGGAGFEGFDFSGSGFEDVFGDFFSGFGSGGGSQRVYKGEDLRFSLSLSLEEAFNGFETTINIPRKIGCSACASSGYDKSSNSVRCSRCLGKGKIYVTQLFFRVEQQCDQCHGSGKSYNSCSKCRGEGRLSENSSIKIKIPRGVEDGINLQLKGEGNAIKGGINGDLYVFIQVKKHSIFAVEKSNLLINIPISVFDAVLGKELDIPTLEKSVYKLKVPSGTQSGASFCLKGYGMYKYNSSIRGDIIVKVDVEIPDCVSDKEKELWLQLQKEYKNTAKSRSFWDKISSYFRGF